MSKFLSTSVLSLQNSFDNVPREAWMHGTSYPPLEFDRAELSQY